MRKKIALCLSLALFVGLLGQTAFGYTMPETVRVGLSANTETPSVSIGNEELWLGQTVDGRFQREARLNGYSGFILEETSDYFVALDDDLRDYEEAKRLAERCEDYGYTAYPGYLGFEAWRVFFPAETYGEARDLEDGVSEDFSGSVEILDAVSEHMLLKSAGKVQAAFGGGVRPQFQGTDEPALVRLGERRYRGLMEFGRYTNAHITAVNVLSLDEYLYAVVPSEMPQSWEAEALKAQAVTARTYALNKLGQHTTSGYHLCDQEHCQVYLGYGNEAASTTAAVDATSGVAVYYDGKPIDAVYCSSSGGHTDNSENVWGGTVAYLKGVAEVNETGAKVWSHTFSAQEIAELCKAEGIDVGRVEDLVIEKTGAGGRILELEIVGTKGSHTLTKENVRYFFSLESRMFQINGVGSGSPAQSGGSGGGSRHSAAGTTVTVTDGYTSLTDDAEAFYALGAEGGSRELGAAVTVQGAQGASKTFGAAKTVAAGAVTEATTGGTADGTGNFVFEGRGWGHGVGMSQYGAKGMAEAGYTYREILSHYYTDVTIQ